MPGEKEEIQSHYFTYFKKLYEAWESSMSHAMELWLKSPMFMDCVMNAAEKSAEFDKYMRGMMERALRHKHLDIKYEINKTGNASDRVGAEINSISDTIEGAGKDFKESVPKKGKRKQKSRRKDQ